MTLDSYALTSYWWTVGLLMLLASISGLVTGTPSDAGRLYSDLERHLQSVKSVEIHYKVIVNDASEPVVGRMLLDRPDRLYHDTPEWTLCVIGDEQWRHLKSQNTIIREPADRTGGWQPDAVLFELKKNFIPLSTEELGGGRRVLRLVSRDASLAATASLEFAAGGVVPEVVTLVPPGGEMEMRYLITLWKENVAVNDSLFEPPSVPPENVIDFRGVEPERQR